MKGLQDCTSFFVFVYSESFSTLQIVVKLFKELQQMNASMLQMNASMLQMNASMLQMNASMLQMNASMLQMNASMLQISNTLIDIKKALMYDVERDTAKMDMLPPSSRAYRENNK